MGYLRNQVSFLDFQPTIIEQNSLRSDPPAAEGRTAPCQAEYSSLKMTYSLQGYALSGGLPHPSVLRQDFCREYCSSTDWMRSAYWKW